MLVNHETTTYREVTFSDADVVNLDAWTCDYCMRAWLFHDHGVAIGIVFAENLQDAFDELADAGKIDSWKVTDEDVERDYDGDYDRLTCLGNVGDFYDTETLSHDELPKTPISFTACFDVRYE